MIKYKYESHIIHYNYSMNRYRCWGANYDMITLQYGNMYNHS